MNKLGHCKKIGIIVLNYNSWQDTIECLQFLHKIDYLNYFVIVVDNASSDGSVEKIKEWADGRIKVIEYEKEIAEQGGVKALEEELQKLPNNKKIVLIKNNTNLGYSAGNNVGIRYAIKKGAEAIFIVNPDVRIDDPEAVRKMVDTMFSRADIFAVGPNIIDSEGNRQNPLREPTFIEECINPFLSALKKPLDYLLPINSDKPFEVEKVSGSCLLIRTSFMKKIGLLDENVFLYCEEPILAAQVKENLGKIYFVSSAVIRHLHRKPSSLQMSQFFKSRLYYLKNYKKYNCFQRSAIKLTHRVIKTVISWRNIC